MGEHACNDDDIRDFVTQCMTKEHFWLQKCHHLQTKQILQYVEDRNLVYRNSLAPIKYLKQKREKYCSSQTL